MSVHIGHAGAVAVRSRAVAAAIVTAVIIGLGRDIDRAAAIVAVIIVASVLGRGNRKAGADDACEGCGSCCTTAKTPAPGAEIGGATGGCRCALVSALDARGGRRH